MVTRKRVQQTFVIGEHIDSSMRRKPSPHRSPLVNKTVYFPLFIFSKYNKAVSETKSESIKTKILLWSYFGDAPVFVVSLLSIRQDMAAG